MNDYNSVASIGYLICKMKLFSFLQIFSGAVEDCGNNFESTLIFNYPFD